MSLPTSDHYLMLVSADNLYKFEISGQVASPIRVDDLLINCLLIYMAKKIGFDVSSVYLNFLLHFYLSSKVSAIFPVQDTVVCLDA